MNLLKRDDEVAILPHKCSPPSEVLEIAIVAYVGPTVIELADGRLYFADDGKSIRDPHGDCILPATEQHRNAWRAKPR